MYYKNNGSNYAKEASNLKISYRRIKYKGKNITCNQEKVKTKHTFPIMLSFSSRNFEERTAATNTLKAPNGVTNAAGAKAYASRLAASPTPTKTKSNI